jgi:hypothetical protein
LSLEADVLEAYMAEVKLTADRLEKDIKDIAETVEKVDDYCKTQRTFGLGKRHEIREIALICYTSVNDEAKNHLVNRLLNNLPSSLKEKRIKDVKVCDLDLILSYCHRTPQGANIARCVAILSKLIEQ